ncbi:MAG: hypothetical protein CMI08_15240 [Oceanospirillaceae bacterium]|uniref:hypothetical protein n=1 Tax=unclassified Thalassolituus TaxID=2624967 RepID=UPI000C5E5E8F|nr:MULTISPECIES: hypothetical protein [unclassified Thalassolituus]MAY00524.1 hypothetical protein [Oceanospirillaceae bacterium]MBL35772.1 hypothetical protein [Oceanospirillaceae bacterium]MBS52944.1 hypothetical protein [Oceanospirillaceae bacterium]MBS53853.1 hypothetical protein [Oceanospirillaceae bacterium]|tara:strand:- start:4001 stop:4240 length:240 start_codon:yes stop_codon:yes gene_type:complete
MKLTEVKAILATGEVKSVDINTVIDSLDVADLADLTAKESATLQSLLTGMQRMQQDPHFAGKINNPEKVEQLVVETLAG